MVRKLIKKILYGKKASCEVYTNYLRNKGMKIGKGFYCPSVRSIIIDETRPWLVDIGDNVILTAGVSILTHGYDLAVIMNKYGELLGSAGKVKIGNNVFIGINSIVLKGVTIGNNVIIGAGSVVNKNIPDNCVVAGNPAKIICTLEEYRNKRKQVYVEEAKDMAKEYQKRYNKKPSIDVFHEFFFIMERRNEIENLNFGFLKIEKVRRKFLETEPLYEGLDEFLESCGIK